jgi:hypothetical protein
MVDPVGAAHEQLHAAHEEHGDKDPWPRRMAVVVSFLAASLAIAAVGAKSAQTGYLTHHIAASDAWSFYQAKNLRATVRDTEAGLLELQPNAESPAVQERIRKARADEARLRDEPGKDGMKQLREKALQEEQERERLFHWYHGYEYTSGTLEISIVLASVSVVTRMRALGIAASAIGMIACVYGLAVYAHLT